jgi:hypothetical protein
MKDGRIHALNRLRRRLVESGKEGCGVSGTDRFVSSKGLRLHYLEAGAGDREKCRALIAKSTEAGAKKSAHDSGSFFGRRLLVGAHPVAAAADVDDSGVPQQAVDDGRGDDRIGKDLAPVREATV